MRMDAAIFTTVVY